MGGIVLGREVNHGEVDQILERVAEVVDETDLQCRVGSMLSNG
jgi:hypothetical protein